MTTKKKKLKKKPQAKQLPPNDDERDEQAPGRPGGATPRRKVSGMGSTFGDGSPQAHDRDVGGKISGM